MACLPPRELIRPSISGARFQGTYETKQYVATALSWQDAGTAIPFAIVREHDRIVLGSTPFWNLERCLWPQGHSRHGRRRPDAGGIGCTWLTHFATTTRSNTRSKL